VEPQIKYNNPNEIKAAAGIFILGLILGQ
jgi:hypothetical protein